MYGLYTHYSAFLLKNCNVICGVKSGGRTADLLSCSLGVESPKEDIDGSQVHATFWEEKDYERIKIYCEKDVETVIQVLLTASKM